ncbi:MAG: hypothetical protein HN797_04765 [Tateyamaria sp.]|nr:hypothetical protein [Tateyamaria sp.]
MRDGKTMIKDLAATLNIVLVILVFSAFFPVWSLRASMQGGWGEVLEPYRWHLLGALLISLAVHKLGWGSFFED